MRDYYRGLGSIDWTGASRSVLLAGHEIGNPANFGFVHIKSNLTAKGKSIGYKIENGRFFWNGESNLTEDKILEQNNIKDVLPREEAKEFLLGFLTGGAQPAEKCKETAKKNGISETTLLRAKKDLGVISRKIGYSDEWVWVMPEKHATKVVISSGEQW